MDVLTVRLDDNISKKIEVILKEFNYSTKTDFVREAIRTKAVSYTHLTLPTNREV